MLKIARIQAWALRSPVQKPVETSFGLMHDRPAVLLRIEDDEGAFGWGEIFANWPAAGAEHRVRLLEKDISALVLGHAYETPDALFHDLSARTQVRAVQCGEIGPFAQVTAGLDIALWDLAARRAEVPLRRLIRPNAPDKVPAYASGIHVAAAAEMMPRARALGYQQFKLKVGFDMDRDIALLSTVLETLGPDERMACDANQAWTLEEAKAFCDLTRYVPMLWLEEPMPVFAARSAWRNLAGQAHITLAGGENVLGEEAFAEVIEDGYLGVIQPDLAKWGGITGCLSVARKALAANRRYCPHFLGAGVGLAASAELLAAAGGDGVLEVDVNPNPLRSEFFGGVEPIENGAWQCASAPGLGIECIPPSISEHVTLSVDLKS